MVLHGFSWRVSVPKAVATTLPPCKRRCVAALAPALHAHDKGIVDLSATGDPLQTRALQIIAERKRRVYGNTLPDRLEVRCLPPHMMHFPTGGYFDSPQEVSRTRDGLPERDTSLDRAIKGIIGFFRRRPPRSAPARVVIRAHGPRLNNIIPMQSFVYPTSFPQGQEGIGTPSLGMMILLSRELQADYELRTALERALCIVAETHCIGSAPGGPVFRLMARRAMLDDPSVLVSLGQADASEIPRQQCVSIRCGSYSVPLTLQNETSVRCPSCASRLALLPDGSRSLVDVLSRRYGGFVSRVGVACGFATLQVLRVLVWPAKPIWSSATPGDIALRTVAFIGAVSVGSLLLLMWIAPRGPNTFLGSSDKIKPLADRRSQMVARANIQEELRLARERDGQYDDAEGKSPTESSR